MILAWQKRPILVLKQEVSVSLGLPGAIFTTFGERLPDQGAEPRDGEKSRLHVIGSQDLAKSPFQLWEPVNSI